MRVRLAVAHALDRDVLNERVWNGTAVVGTQLLDSTSQFYADVPFPEYDPEAAKARVYGDPQDEAPPFLHRMIAEGRLGERAGRGFYDYPDPAYRRPGWLEGEG